MKRKADERGTIPLHVRLAPEVAERLYGLAKESGYTVTAVIAQLISDARIVEVQVMQNKLVSGADVSAVTPDTKAVRG